MLVLVSAVGFIGVVIVQCATPCVLPGVVRVSLRVPAVMLRRLLLLLFLLLNPVAGIATSTGAAVAVSTAGQTYSGERRYGVTPDEELRSIDVLANHGPDDGVLSLLLLGVAMSMSIMVGREEDVVDVTVCDHGVRVDVQGGCCRGQKDRRQGVR